MHIIPAVKTGHSITATFQLPSLRSEYPRKPEDYLSHLVGHEGGGSLLSALKGRGWASQLTAGVGEGGFERSSATYLFDVSVTLTEAGLAAGPGALQLLYMRAPCCLCHLMLLVKSFVGRNIYGAGCIRVGQLAMHIAPCVHISNLHVSCYQNHLCVRLAFPHASIGSLTLDGHSVHDWRDACNIPEFPPSYPKHATSVFPCHLPD